MMKLTGGLDARFALAATDSGWHAVVDDTWRGWSGPHGGTLGGLMIEVARRSCAHDHPVRAADIRFLGRPATGAFTLRATEKPVGRTTTVLDVVAEQDGAPVAAATVVLGAAGTSAIAAHTARPAPPVPAPEDCPLFQLPPEIVPVGAHFAIRPAAGPLPLSGADEAMMCAWITLEPALPVDAPSLAILADALPPGLFPLLTAPVAVPTVTLSLHLHAAVADLGAGPVLVRAVNVSTDAGWSVDDIDLWDRDGVLLASARQTRRVLG
ncbi:thioesterase family protein [Nocardia asteroides NBRC 15531]|nr:thioesterase family protein [Nocardia asteroides]TLF67248.1 thioesterase family protein [Nocardia asteroides NBRC 15531]UGT51465.1 thioesterase family protein [Nocardia asteroides]